MWCKNAPHNFPINSFYTFFLFFRFSSFRLLLWLLLLLADVFLEFSCINNNKNMYKERGDNNSLTFSLLKSYKINHLFYFHRSVIHSVWLSIIWLDRRRSEQSVSQSTSCRDVVAVWHGNKFFHIIYHRAFFMFWNHTNKNKTHWNFVQLKRLL